MFSGETVTQLFLWDSQTCQKRRPLHGRGLIRLFQPGDRGHDVVDFPALIEERRLDVDRDVVDVLLHLFRRLPGLVDDQSDVVVRGTLVERTGRFAVTGSHDEHRFVRELFVPVTVLGPDPAAAGVHEPVDHLELFAGRGVLVREAEGQFIALPFVGLREDLVDHLLVLHRPGGLDEVFNGLRASDAAGDVHHVVRHFCGLRTEDLEADRQSDDRDDGRYDRPEPPVGSLLFFHAYTSFSVSDYSLLYRKLMETESLFPFLERPVLTKRLSTH